MKGCISCHYTRWSLLSFFGIDLHGVEWWEFDVSVDENNKRNGSWGVLFTPISVDCPLF
jgi:hypothetical protein